MKFGLLLLALLLAASGVSGQQPPSLPFVCPMDPDVRSATAGMCPKCGMALVNGLPEHREYPVKLRTQPEAVRPGEPTRLAFEVIEPDSGLREIHFNTVHEKIFHLLYVSHDLEVFAHEHPALGDDGVFRLTHTFPKEGAYRLLADFFPQHGTPQMTPLTLTTAGFEGALGIEFPQLQTDLSTKTPGNLSISLRTEPTQPLATFKTLLFFELDTSRGLEKFLGAWAHMLAASQDTVDLIHAHPAVADGGRLIQMNIIFPRPGSYRVWVQVQRKGIVNTAPFTLQVGAL